MSSDKLNTITPNNEIGLFFTKARRVVVGQDFKEMALWIQAGTAGTIVWYNEEISEYGVLSFEAGESKPIACTKIVSSAVIDGVTETTTSGNMFWMTSAQRIGRN